MISTKPRTTAIPPDPNRVISALSRNWILIVALLYGLFVGLPFLAPVLMHASWYTAGNAIYWIYSLFCHQLPERSFFLFTLLMKLVMLACFRRSSEGVHNGFLVFATHQTCLFLLRIEWKRSKRLLPNIKDALAPQSQVFPNP